MSAHPCQAQRARAIGTQSPTRLPAYLGGIVLALALTAPGCVTTMPWTPSQEAAPAVCQVHTFWDGRIQVPQDVVNGGRPLPGLAGRLYLFGQEFGIPLKGDGSVAVDLYDISSVPPGVEPKRLERWQMDAGTMAKLLRRDKIGWGYTVFLPWSTYSPDIKRVRLNICYTPAKGTPIYAEPATISLHNQVSATQTRQVAAATGAPVK
jgi:hypothetical protein